MPGVLTSRAVRPYIKLLCVAIFFLGSARCLQLAYSWGYFEADQGVGEVVRASFPRIHTGHRAKISVYILSTMRKQTGVQRLRHLWRSSSCRQHYQQEGVNYTFIVGVPQDVGHDLTQKNQGGIDTEHERAFEKSLLGEMMENRDIELTNMRETAGDMQNKLLSSLMHWMYEDKKSEFLVIHNESCCIDVVALHQTIARFARTNGSLVMAGPTAKAGVLRGTDVNGFLLPRRLVQLIVKDDILHNVLTPPEGEQALGERLLSWIDFARETHRLELQYAGRVPLQFPRELVIKRNLYPWYYAGILSGAGSEASERRLLWRQSGCGALYENANITYSFVLGVPTDKQEISIASKEIYKEQQQWFDLNVMATREADDASFKLLAVMRSFYFDTDADFLIIQADTHCLEPSSLHAIVSNHIEQNTGNVLWTGIMLWKGDEYEQMKGPNGETATYFSSLLSAMSRDLVGIIVSDDFDHSLMKSLYGTAAADSNLGKWVKHASEKHLLNVDYVPGLKGSSVKEMMTPPDPPRPRLWNSTVAVIIPFRDRESHLGHFREHWRNMVVEQRRSKIQNVIRWEIYIVEQFDGGGFNRGWTFNVGLADALGMESASPDTTPSQIELDCAVIQDVDTLPETVVDYADCEFPTQLGSEMDRFGYSVPYLQYTGGVVGMSPLHWKAINGFGNEYIGWGGEDDELYHRLRLNGLLKGDCSPLCSQDDSNRHKEGLSIRRPPKGFGRFGGGFMDTKNHTKRDRSTVAYQQNLKMLAEISNGSPRWKTDGLSNLRFRVIERKVDTSEEAEYGIVYHHLRVRRGDSDFDPWKVGLAVPTSLCQGPGEKEESTRSLAPLAAAYSDLPWRLHDLRTLAKQRALQESGGECPRGESASFIAIDLRLGLGKILRADEQIKVFYRSLQNPTDGLIVADARSPEVIEIAFIEVGAVRRPVVPFQVCTLAAGEKFNAEFKYSIQAGDACAGGWDKSFNFSAAIVPFGGAMQISYCFAVNTWQQRVVKDSICEGSWQGKSWQQDGTFYVQRSEKISYCVGSQQRSGSFEPLSIVLQEKDCGVDHFHHDFTFPAWEEPTTESSVSMSVCIGLSNDNVLKISSQNDCDSTGHTKMIHFAAMKLPENHNDDDDVRTFCVVQLRGGGQRVLPKKTCLKEDLDRFAFSVPKNSFGTPLCFSDSAGSWKETADGSFVPDCEQQPLLSEKPIKFKIPSLTDVADSTPNGGKDRHLYALILEKDCASFICREGGN